MDIMTAVRGHYDVVLYNTDIPYNSAMTEAEYKSAFTLSKDIHASPQQVHYRVYSRKKNDKVMKAPHCISKVNASRRVPVDFIGDKPALDQGIACHLSAPNYSVVPL